MSAASPIKVCVAGCSGWTGAELVKAMLHHEAPQSLKLVSAVARKLADSHGKIPDTDIPVFATVEQALKFSQVDVLVDYTHPTAVKGHALQAISHGVNVVIGTSGLKASDYADIEAKAVEHKVGVIAAGNFSVTAALMKHCALQAAQHVKEFEVFDYAYSKKPDVPSGTARELAESLSKVQKPEIAKPIDSIIGPKEARGASIEGVQVHSIRLPSYVLACEVVFGKEDERLTIRHDAGSSAKPYVSGTLIAIQRVVNLKGQLVRGLDTLLFGGQK